MLKTLFIFFIINFTSGHIFCQETVTIDVIMVSVEDSTNGNYLVIGHEKKSGLKTFISWIKSDFELIEQNALEVGSISTFCAKEHNFRAPPLSDRRLRINDNIYTKPGEKYLLFWGIELISYN